jgi:hypothetical protein
MSLLLFKGFVAQIVTSGINPLLRISTIEIMVCAISSEPSLLDCSLRVAIFSRSVSKCSLLHLDLLKLLNIYFRNSACQD